MKRTRRGKKQSNIYITVKADQITIPVVHNLSRSHTSYLQEIAEDDKKARNMRLVKRELEQHKSNRDVARKRLKQKRYPQTSEVQLVDFHSKAFQASTSSSNRNNDSKENLGAGERRGEGFKSIASYIHLPQKLPPSRAPGGPATANSPGVGEWPSRKSPAVPGASQPLSAYAKIREVVCKISGDIHDQKHALENISQAIRIFKKVRERKEIDADGFIQSLWNARGLTLEILHLLDRPGAYFFAILRKFWGSEKLLLS